MVEASERDAILAALLGLDDDIAESKLENYRRQFFQIDQHIAQYEVDYGAWQEAHSELEKERQTGGGEAQREAKVTEAETKLTESTEAIQQNN